MTTSSSSVTIEVKDEDKLIKEVFLVTLNPDQDQTITQKQQPQQQQYEYLYSLDNRASFSGYPTNNIAPTPAVDRGGGGSGTQLLTRAVLDHILREKVPSAFGLSYLFQCYIRTASLLKQEKDERKLSLLQHISSKIVQHAKLVLLEQQYFAEQHQDDLYMSSPDAPLPSELREQFDQVPPGFLDQLVATCEMNEVKIIFVPVVTEWVIDMGKLCENAHFLKKLHQPLLKKVSCLVSNPQLINLLSHFLEREISSSFTQTAREMETKSIIASFLGMHTTFNQALNYFDPKVLPQYPHCTVIELNTMQNSLRVVLDEIHREMHANMKKIFLCKEDNQKPKEVLLQWISKILDLNELRATANPIDPLYLEMTMICSTEGFLLNLMFILLLFSKPFLDHTAAGTDKRKMISPYYCLFSKRLDYAKQDKLCNCSNPLNFKVDEISKFGFVSDIFFLTYHCLHVGLTPAIATYKSRVNHLAQIKQQVQLLTSQFGPSNPAVINLNKNMLTIFPIIDGYDVHLAHPELLNNMIQFCTLAMRWLLDLVKETPDSDVLCSIFSSFPVYFMKDILDYIDFCARFHPKVLAKAHLPTFFEFCVVFMNQAKIVKSPLVRARLSLLLGTFHYLSKPTILPTTGNWNAPSQNQPNALTESEKINYGYIFLQNQSDSSTKELLIPGLMRCYLDIGDVEGLDVDKDQIDKYTVRKDIANLFNNLGTQPNFAVGVKNILLSNNLEYQSQKFLSTVLSDSIMLLDDSLHRLTDIKTLQTAMETPDWKTQIPEIREKRERYYAGQERSAAAFMASAVAILSFLGYLSREVVEPFLKTPGMIQKMVSMLLWFLHRLCGPQMSALAVKNPEKYAYNPKELLGNIVTIGNCFAENRQFIQTMSEDLDYSSELMSKTYNIMVNKKILPSYETDKFKNFINNVNKQITANKAKQQTIAITTDVGMSESLPPMDEEESEELYKGSLQHLLFDETIFKKEDGTYFHHYNDNILKSDSSGTSKQKLQKLTKECGMMATDLPLSRSSSIFIRVDSERMDVMKAIITGPKGTPYSYGVYIFDIFFPPSYPHDPPLVNLETTGNGTVRFNPNLYTDGKVCLSLLGTWHGESQSKWNPVQSTIIQALISIQGFIFCDEPYYNEPSYEAQRDTKEGNEASASYNENIQYNNIRYAMIQNLRQPTEGFEDIIRTHFSLLKNDILDLCDKWIATAKDKPKMVKVVEQLKLELKK